MLLPWQLLSHTEAQTQPWQIHLCLLCLGEPGQRGGVGATPRLAPAQRYVGALRMTPVSGSWEDPSPTVPLSQDGETDTYE